jgi:ArsR family transcriptional regulator
MHLGHNSATAADTPPQPAMRAIPVLRALSDPTRLGLIRCLLKGERCVGDLTDALGLRQPRISHHLAILRRLELVVDRRAGKKIFYRLHPRWQSDARLDLGDLRLEFRR